MIAFLIVKYLGQLNALLNWVSNIFHEFIYFFKISLKICQFYSFSPLVFVLVGGLFPLNFLLTSFFAKSQVFAFV